MNKETYIVSEDELLSFVDGSLSDARIKDVEEYLIRNPDELKRIESYCEHRDLLGKLYHNTDEELLQRIEEHSQKHNKSTSRNSYSLTIAASITWLVLGLIIGWNFNTNNLQQPSFVFNLPQRALVSHRVFSPEVLHPVEVRANQEKHLQKWLSNRLERKLIIPNLNVIGYNLIGGRLLTAENGPAAQFMFENNSGERLTYYVVVSDHRDSAFHYHENDNIRVFSWNTTKMGFAIVGSIQKEQLYQAAKLIYGELLI